MFSVPKNAPLRFSRSIPHRQPAAEGRFTDPETAPRWPTRPALTTRPAIQPAHGDLGDRSGFFWREQALRLALGFLRRASDGNTQAAPGFSLRLLKSTDQHRQAPRVTLTHR